MREHRAPDADVAQVADIAALFLGRPQANRQQAITVAVPAHLDAVEGILKASRHVLAADPELAGKLFIE